MRSLVLALALAALSACNNDVPMPLTGTRDASAPADASSGRDAGPSADATAATDAEPADAGPIADAEPADAAPNADATPSPDADPSTDADPNTDAAPSTADAALPDGGGPFAGYTASSIAMPPWVDACATGAALTLTDDDDGHSDPPTMLPFTFDFWGAPVASLSASINGYLVFDATPTDAFEPGIPDTGEGAAIYALWEDLFVHAPSLICVATTGAAPDRTVVIEWQAVASLGAGDDTTLTFEVVLHEGTHAIDLVYQTLSSVDPVDARYVDGSEAAIGLQSALGAASLVHAGTVSTTTGLRFTP